MQRRTRAGASTVITTVGLVSLLLAGCAVQAPTAVTDAQARDRFLSVLDESQSLVGGEWRVLDDPTPRECVIPLWVAGERYPALRVGDAPVNVTLAADRVEAAWNAHDIHVTRTDVGDVIELKGQTLDGELLIIRVSESASTVLGESECRPA